MIDIVEICRRAASGPLVAEGKFDRELFFPKVQALVKKYELKPDLNNPVCADDALADTVLPCDEHPSMCGTDALDVRKQVLYDLAFTHDPEFFGDGILKRFLLIGKHAAGDGVSYRKQDAIPVRRLLKKVECADLGSLDRRRDSAMAGNHDNRQCRIYQTVWPNFDDCFGLDRK